jgi:hypothetical protein
MPVMAAQTAGHQRFGLPNQDVLGHHGHSVILPAWTLLLTGSIQKEQSADSDTDKQLLSVVAIVVTHEGVPMIEL